VNVTKDAPVAGSARLSALPKNTLENFAKWGAALVRPPLVRTPPLPPSAFVAIILTPAVAIAVMFGVDTAASDWAHHLPRWFIDAFEEITNFGLGGWFLIPSAFVFLCLAAVAAPTLPRITQGVLAALAARFGFLFLAVGAPGLFDTIIKRLIGRARPYVSHDDPFAYMPFIWRSEYASMPSGHSANVAAAAIAIGALWPKTRPVMWLFALLIMFSRVVVLAHHPSDVIVGALVGAVGAVLVRRWFAARRLVFSAHELKAFPGPSLQRAMAAARQILLDHSALRRRI
jgi:membrane-associated phospholipid phosphatase